MQIISLGDKLLYYSCCHYRHLFWHHLWLLHTLHLKCLLCLSLLSLCLSMFYLSVFLLQNNSFAWKYSSSPASSLFSSVLEEFHKFSSPPSLYWFQHYRSDLQQNKSEWKARNLMFSSVLHLHCMSPSELFILKR